MALRSTRERRPQSEVVAEVLATKGMPAGIGAADGFQFAFRVNDFLVSNRRQQDRIFSVWPNRTVLVSIVETSISILGRNRIRRSLRDSREGDLVPCAPTR